MLRLALLFIVIVLVLVTTSILGLATQHKRQEALCAAYSSLLKEHENYIDGVFDNIHDDDLEDLLENNYI